MIFIYILIDPITLEIRYVGKTNNPYQRFRHHLVSSANPKSHKRNWINSLREEGLKPIMQIIDEVEEIEWQFWEQYWIVQLKCWGFDLVNHTAGGDGLTRGNQTSFKKGQKIWCDTNTFIICQQCNKEFRCPPSRLNIKKFCSMKCYSENKKGQSFQNNGSFQEGHEPWNKGKTYKTKKL